MKKSLLLLLAISFFTTISIANSSFIVSGCADAGTASATADSICYEDTVTLSLAGYVGTIFQWQSFDGAVWNNETGPGATTPSYDVVPGVTKSFRAIVGDTGCPDDTSNQVLITVGVIPVPTGTGASRCGYGQVTLTGSGSGTLRWYSVPSGGIQLATGNSYSPTVSSTTTFYLENNVSGGSGGTSPLLISELDLGGNDYLELQNVSNQPVDVTGWKVAINNSYTDINIVNPNVQVLSGIMNPGDIITFTDNTAGPNYWGSNMLWNPGSFPTFTGWVIVLDDANVLKDFIALNWPIANIQGMNPIVSGFPVTIGSNWTTDGVDITSVTAATGVSRIGNADNNTLGDFSILNLSIGITNAGLTLPFTGFGCSSPRIPVTATVTASPPISISGTGSICEGDSTVLTVSSANPNYNYTWSPATGLSTTTGAVTTASPVSPITYTVLADDGTCGAIDSIFINVGPASMAGSAAASGDTICSGDDVTLTLSGSVGSIQWQSNTGTGWMNETGPGSTSAQYVVTPGVNTSYQAIVTSAGCPSDTSITLEVVVISVTTPVTTDSTRCGTGTVTLLASSPPGTTVNWYTSPGSAGQPIYTGNTFVTPQISSTTTYYASTMLGNVVPVLFSEDFEGGVSLPAGWTATGLWHVTSACVTGSPPNPSNWAYYGDDGQCDFDVPSGTAHSGELTTPVINIPGAAASAELRFWYIYDGENGTPPNGFDNATVQISQNGGPFTQQLALTGGGNPTNVWTPATLSLVPYIGSTIQLRWTFATIDGIANAFLGLQIDSIIIRTEGACESSRVPVTATVTPSTPISISGANALCLGDSTVLTVSSANPNYNYTWSPSTGLSTTSGAVTTATPVVPTTYTVLGDDGTCGAIDSIYINVGPNSNSGTAMVTTDTVCLGSSTTLILNGTVGSIQWQSNTGTGWINETGSGSDSTQYIVSPTVNTSYQAVVTSGGCPADTSIILNVVVQTISAPTTINDTICGPGTVNLTATGGGGTYAWYTSSTGGNVIGTGSPFTPTITGTTTYYVEARGGGTLNEGPSTNGFGTQAVIASSDFGLWFDVLQQITLEKVHVYTAQTGNITINLRATQGGPILNTKTVPVTIFSAHYPVTLGWTIPPGTGYRLELATGSSNLYYNTNGAMYPYQLPGSPLQIKGYLNPAPTTGAIYYYFYDWEIGIGCVSSRVPATGVVLPAPPVPTITQMGNQLTSSSPTNNQWYFNGNPIPGATNQVYIVSSPGTYTVRVTDPSNGCASESLPVVIVSVSEISWSQADIKVYPNPVQSILHIAATDIKIEGITVRNLIGEILLKKSGLASCTKCEIDFSQFKSGLYLLELRAAASSRMFKIVKM